MQRIGMNNINQNFNPPLVPIGHPLEEHVLYSIKQELFIKSNTLE